MSTVQEIELAISGLAPHELKELYAWMNENSPHPFDVQLESDLNAGLLDARILRALSEHATGGTREF